MKLDFTITLGDLLVALGSLSGVLGIGLAFLRRWDRLWDWTKYYPPHRHKKGAIEYPAELEDGAAEHLDKKVTA